MGAKTRNRLGHISYHWRTFENSVFKLGGHVHEGSNVMNQAGRPPPTALICHDPEPSRSVTDARRVESRPQTEASPMPLCTYGDVT